jgi:hypothetical protein
LGAGQKQSKGSNGRDNWGNCDPANPRELNQGRRSGEHNCTSKTPIQTKQEYTPMGWAQQAANPIRA